MAQARSTSGLLYLVTTPISRYVATICAVVRVTDQHRCICDVSFAHATACPRGGPGRSRGRGRTARVSRAASARMKRA